MRRRAYTRGGGGEGDDSRHEIARARARASQLGNIEKAVANIFTAIRAGGTRHFPGCTVAR